MNNSQAEEEKYASALLFALSSLSSAINQGLVFNTCTALVTLFIEEAALGGPRVCWLITVKNKHYFGIGMTVCFTLTQHRLAVQTRSTQTSRTNSGFQTSSERDKTDQETTPSRSPSYPITHVPNKSLDLHPLQSESSGVCRKRETSAHPVMVSCSLLRSCPQSQLQPTGVGDFSVDEHAYRFGWDHGEAAEEVHFHLIGRIYVELTVCGRDKLLQLPNLMVCWPLSFSPYCRASLWLITFW